MINIIKNKLKKNPKIYKILQVLKFLYNTKWIKSYKFNKHPQVLQFPITNNCNSKCVMCNITSNISKKEMTVDEFKKIINDDIFKEIKLVGINGGEPFLCKNLIPFIEILVKKEKLESINIISNGFLTNSILEKTKKIYEICKKYNIKFHISFSLDGYGKIHDKVRGIPNVFSKTIETISSIVNNKEFYCDSYDIGCTVVKQNVDYLVELESFAEKMNWNIKFRLGIKNERLHNSKIYDGFSILEDKQARQSAKEFFFGQILKSKNLYDQYKYWAIFTYLDGDENRKLGCDWQENGITLDGEGNIYYCAVESPCIGNLKNNDGSKLFFCKENLKVRTNIRKNKCKKCIHDYVGQFEYKNVIKFLYWKFNRKFVMKKYR